jgi:putative peptidoglycan lipid II flippase
MKDETQRSVFGTALLLLPMQIVFRAGEAALPLLIAMWFGRSAETDLYFLGAAFFVFAGSLVAASFQDSALVPILAELKAEEPAEVPRVAGSLLMHALVYGGAIAVLVGAFALGWAWLHAAEVPFGVARTMIPAFVLWMVALGARSFFAGMLNANGWYFAPPIASGLGMTASLLLLATLHRQLGIVIVPVGSLAAEVVATLVLAWIAIRKAKLPLVLSLVRSEPVMRFWKLVAAAVAGATITRINPMIDQLMARLSDVVGGGTLLRLAGDVASVPTSLAQAALFSVLLSQLSREAARGAWEDFASTLRRALWGTMGVLAAASLLLALARGPLLRLVFLHGAMDEGGVERLAEVLPWALLGVAPFGAVLLFALAHVALQNNRIMIALGVLNAALNLGFDWLLVGPFGLRGIALATSLMHVAIALVFWWLLRVKLRELRADGKPTTLEGLDDDDRSPGAPER